MGKAANEIHRKSRAALIKEGYDAGWSDARVKSIPLDDEVLVQVCEALASAREWLADDGCPFHAKPLEDVCQKAGCCAAFDLFSKIDNSLSALKARMQG